MKKFITLLAGIAFCAGCHIPYPSIGRRQPQVVETYEKVCVVTIKKDKDKDGIHDLKTTKCRWVRSK